MSVQAEIPVKERRKSFRYRGSWPLAITDMFQNVNNCRSRLKDLSSGGFCFQSAAALSPGGRFSFSLEIPGVGLIEGLAQVCWSAAPESSVLRLYGARILQLDPVGDIRLRGHIRTLARLQVSARRPRESRLHIRADSSPRIDIRPIRDRSELESVYRLTHDCYVEQGYISPRPDGRLVHYPRLDNIPETTVLVAAARGRIVSSNSLTLDGPRGLHVDDDFKSECDQIRKEGRKLAASWRIVTNKLFRDDRRIILKIIGETVRCALRLGVQTCVFTFNPRHESVYQRLLNMRTIARSETIGAFSAPAVFMRLDLERLPSRWLDAR